MTPIKLVELAKKAGIDYNEIFEEFYTEHVSGIPLRNMKHFLALILEEKGKKND